MSDDKYDVSGVETDSFEFPDTATPLVSDDKTGSDDDFWASFKSDLRSSEQPKQQPAAEPKLAAPKAKAKPAPKQQPAAEPKPAAPKAKAKSSEYDLESILAEFKDL